MIGAKWNYGFALKAIAVVACLATILLPQLRSSLGKLSFDDPSRTNYRSVTDWINAADCARTTGAWAALCEDDKLVAITADDPGHMIVLALWARIADRKMTVADVGRLNLAINTLGLLGLASTLLLLRAFWPALTLMTLGPYVYLEWVGTSPHWTFIGVVSLQLILPLGIVAFVQRWLRPEMAWTLIGLGLASLAFAALIRESIAIMAVLVTMSTIAVMGLTNRRAYRLLGILSALAVGTVIASQVGHASFALRNALFEIDTAEISGTHGISHNLYLGLGGVPTKFGTNWDDDDGLAAAQQVKPTVVFYSPEYFRILRNLYFDKWRSDPAEVLRIYAAKLLIFLDSRILDSAPPLGVFLALVAGIHLVANGMRLSRGSEASDIRLALTLVTLAFVGLYVLQAILTHATRFFAMPVGALMVVLVGAGIENVGAWARRIVEALRVGRYENP